MLRCRIALASLLAVALGAASAQAIIVDVQAFNSTDPVGAQISPVLFDEDVEVFVDRTHEYNGATAGSPINSTALLGLEYVQTANDDKSVGRYKLDVTVDQDATMVLFVDNRIDINNNAMNWVDAMGFVDSGFDIGYDEGGDGTGPGAGINQTGSVYLLNVSAGTHTFYRGDGNNMWGVAVGASSGTPIRPRLISDVDNINSADGNDLYRVIPNALREDAPMFIDRNHEYNDVPAILLGADYVQTANDDKGAASLQTNVAFAEDATLYVMVDNRLDRNTTMSWMFDGSLGFTFADTGLDIGVDEGGDGVGPGQGINQTSHVYAAQVPAGMVTLFGEVHGGNHYGIAATSADTFSPFAVRSLIVNGTDPERTTLTVTGENGLQNGSLAFVDRTHEWENVPDFLLGAQYVRTANDDRSVSGSDYLTFDLEGSADVYIFLDDRLTAANLQRFLDLGFMDTGLDVGVDEGGNGDINNTSSVYALLGVSGSFVLPGQNQGGTNNFGVALIAGAAGVPEPTSALLGLLGIGALGMRRRRQTV